MASGAHRIRQNTASEKGNKYDFSHLDLAEIDAELAAIGSNLERDMGKRRSWPHGARARPCARGCLGPGSSAAEVRPRPSRADCALRLKRQYEKRERALRAARATKTGGAQVAPP